jgi:hypothetical protein
MAERVFDAELVNAIANSKGMGGYADWSRYDFTEAIKDPFKVFLHDDGGIAICSWCAPRTYECHLFFLPKNRGRRAVAATKRMIDYMVPHLATALWVQPALDDKRTQWLARQCGFKVDQMHNHPDLGPVLHMTRGIA